MNPRSQSGKPSRPGPFRGAALLAWVLMLLSATFASAQHPAEPGRVPGIHPRAEQAPGISEAQDDDEQISHDPYGWLVIGAVSLCLIEALVIFALLAQQARRGLAEEELHENHSRIEDMAICGLLIKGWLDELHESHSRIEDMAGRLIAAHEEERRYIARELHDDLNQQVAALAIGLGKLGRQLPGANGSLGSQLVRLEERAAELSERIRRLSHELHSSTLEHVGLPEALKLHCSEFIKQQGIAVSLNLDGRAEALRPDVALCLYRVAQEALRNVAKHSGAKSARLTLIRDEESVELRVEDRGVGFDLKKVRGGCGLGLASMEERVRLLDGRLEIESRPGAGTRLKAFIPLRSEP